MPLAPGTRLGPYEILAPLGAGAMGEVYRARDTRLKRDVAIKVLRATLADVPARLMRFEREAQTLAALNHPHIAHIYGVELDACAFVMELVEGEDLAERLTRGPIAIEQALPMARQMVDALAYAHSRGIVHRDLKPANIKLTADGRIKLLDFGIAKAVAPPRGADLRTESVIETTGASPANSQTVTEGATLIGSPAYLSPEQARGAPATSRADVWGFGVVLFEMLAGVRAFPGETAADTIAAILRGEPDWKALPANVPTSLRALLERCLERQATRRVDDLNDVRGILEHAEAEIARTGLADPARTATGRRADRSIVVLPFSNLSPDPDNAYFSDGLTEELIADLSKIATLRVISRSSAMRLKGTTELLARVAQQLDVRYVLEGSVRKAGNQLRITAQLIDTDLDASIWADKYSGVLDDIFEIQARVSRAIVDSLRLQLTPEDERRLTRTPTSSGFAFDVYLRARRDILTFLPDRLEQARRDLKHALSVIGHDVLLYRAMGTLAWQYINAGIRADSGLLDEAEECAKRVLQLDPDGAHGPALLGLIAIHRGNPHEWVRQCERAVDADPSDADSLSWLAVGWIITGRPEWATPVLERLRAIDPYSELLHVCLGMSAYLSGQFGQAIPRLRRAMELAPDNTLWPLLTARATASTGDIDGTAAAIDKSYPHPSAHALSTLAHVFKAALLKDLDTVQRLRTPEFEALIWSDFDYTHIMGQSLALVGDLDAALKWLDRAVSRGHLSHAFFATLDPFMMPLRSDPRFISLLERMRKEWERFPLVVASKPV